MVEKYTVKEMYDATIKFIWKAFLYVLLTITAVVWFPLLVIVLCLGFWRCDKCHKIFWANTKKFYDNSYFRSNGMIYCSKCYDKT